ncbi:hypothetical protein ACX0GZ_02485 [Sphingomonas aestuarii]
MHDRQTLTAQLNMLGLPTDRPVMVHAGLRSIAPISDDSDGIAVWPHGDCFPQILIDFLDDGGARTGPVDDCIAELIDDATFSAFALWMERELR